MRGPRMLSLAIALMATASPSAADTVSLSVSGNEATGVIALPGGLGADLTLTFEDPTGLTADALDVSADVVNPLDMTLLSRLPADGVGIPGGFPVLIRIEPAAGSTLAFRGTYAVSVHTGNLNYLPGSPLGLASAASGADFHDITSSLGSGSVRAGGTKGTFCDFLILTDTRTIDTIIGEKYDALENALETGASLMSTPVATDLTARLQQSRSAWASGNTAAALTALDGFASAVLTQSGTAIPDEWAAGSDEVNVAGLLRAGAATLDFSLNRKLTGTP